MRKNKKKRKILLLIENVFLVVLAILTITILCYAFIKPDRFYEKLDSALYKVFKFHIYGDIDKKVNSNDIIPIASNKDYSNSIYKIYYELLDNDKKDIYNTIYTSILNYDKDVVIPDISTDIISDILHSILYDHPEIFWIDINYGIYKGDITKIVFEYKYDIDTINKDKSIIENEISNIVKEAKLLKTDYEKELYVHDYLIKNITYDKSIDDQTIYNLFINKKALCTGYAKAFQLIMTRLNIPTYTITGYTDEDHAWNIIELEDGFYNIDITSDDKGDTIIYKYFNLTGNMISKDHDKDEMSIKIKYNNGSKYLNTYSTLYEKNK